MSDMTAICMGVHVLDVLVRPVEQIPEGQGGELLLSLLERAGIDTSLLVRRDEAQTSASVLPIRPDGSRPAFHVIGANAHYSAADAPWDAIAAATHLHLGAPEFMGGDQAAQILSFAREHGVVTSADILAPGEQAAQIVDW